MIRISNCTLQNLKALYFNDRFISSIQLIRISNIFFISILIFPFFFTKSFVLNKRMRKRRNKKKYNFFLTRICFLFSLFFSLRTYTYGNHNFFFLRLNRRQKCNILQRCRAISTTLISDGMLISLWMIPIGQ